MCKIKKFYILLIILTCLYLEGCCHNEKMGPFIISSTEGSSPSICHFENDDIFFMDFPVQPCPIDTFDWRNYKRYVEAKNDVDAVMFAVSHDDMAMHPNIFDKIFAVESHINTWNIRRGILLQKGNKDIFLEKEQVDIASLRDDNITKNYHIDVFDEKLFRDITHQINGNANDLHIIYISTKNLQFDTFFQFLDGIKGRNVKIILF